MLIRMQHKLIDNILAWMLGISTYSIAWINLHLSDGFAKFLLAMFSAFCAGFIGYLGKRACGWAIRKVKYFFTSKNKAE